MKTSNFIHSVIPVDGMSCASCAVGVESQLSKQVGVQLAEVNYANKQVKLVYDAEETSLEKLKSSVQLIGYDLWIENIGKQQQITNQLLSYQALKRRVWGAGLLALPVFIIGMFFMDMPYANYIMLVFSLPILCYFGNSFFINAYKQAKHGTATMDTLVAISTGIAFIFSVFNTFLPDIWHQQGLHAHVYYEASAVVIAFILLGRLLEEKAKSNTSSAIQKLMGLQPNTVNVIQGTEVVVQAIETVSMGSKLWIRSGERIPVDGSIYEGESYVDERMLTGEPIAVAKKVGHKVFAGTINQQGSFKMHAEQVGAETMLANIIKRVEAAQGSKAPVQKLVDKIAGIFVPIVLVLSALTFCTWVLLGGENGFLHGFLSAITVLIIACPCALGLATPTAIMVGIGKGATEGILIKDAEALELAHRVDAVVVDKTGTLTVGAPVVSHFTWLIQEHPLYRNILYTLESASEHPLALSVVNHLKGQMLVLQNFTSVTGKGVVAEYEGEKYWVGSPKFLKEFTNTPAPSVAKEWELQANTVVYFGKGNELLAVLGIADAIKEGSREAIEQLLQQGKEVYMLTGDNEQTAAAVAEVCGIKNFKAQVSPQEKSAFIAQLKARGKVVAMIGDGINDSEALALADVSIAMGQGSDIAMDVAKITLVSSDLRKIPQALKLSRQTVRTIRQNLFWAFIYNIIGIPLAAGILYPINGFLLDPMMAGAAMALSSVSVVTNSLKLKYFN